MKYISVKNKPKEEKLSERDLKELMNVNAPRFKKQRGIWRRKYIGFISL